MNDTIKLRLPISLYKKAKELADKEKISLDQLISSALAEKLSAFMTQEYLEKRAKRGNKKKFIQVLAKVPDVEPEKYDRIAS